MPTTFRPYEPNQTLLLPPDPFALSLSKGLWNGLGRTHAICPSLFKGFLRKRQLQSPLKRGWKAPKSLTNDRLRAPATCRTGCGHARRRRRAGRHP